MSTLTIRELVTEYCESEFSPYKKLRQPTRNSYNGMLRRIVDHVGDVRLSAVNYRTLLAWHKHWTKGGRHVVTGHGFMSMYRTLFGFGLMLLEDDECERLVAVMSKAKFEMGKHREQHLTAEQVIAIRMEARRVGRGSIALAQAIQFEGTFRQKDIVGEWVDRSEPGLSEIVSPRFGKWLRGIRWNEIDANLILKHVTSKKQKLVTVDLKLADMVMEEWARDYPGLLTGHGTVNRHLLPDNGPVIVDEETGRPYLTWKFRKLWRAIATTVGVPQDVQNRDTRAGAITEAKDAGASLDDARIAAAHSSTDQTADYWRGDEKAIARTMKTRGAARRAQQRDEDVA